MKKSGLILGLIGLLSFVAFFIVQKISKDNERKEQRNRILEKAREQKAANALERNLEKSELSEDEKTSD